MVPLISETNFFEDFTLVCEMFQLSQGTNIEKIRTNQENMFSDQRIHHYCQMSNISHNFSNPNSSPNWITERSYRMIEEMARSMMSHKQLPSTLWKYAITTACYLTNRVTLRSHTNVTPYEMWFGKQPNLDWLRVFGASCQIIKDNQETTEGILIGYSAYSESYRVLETATKEIFHTKQISIDEVSEFNSNQSNCLMSVDHEPRSTDKDISA